MLKQVHPERISNVASASIPTIHASATAVDTNAELRMFNHQREFNSAEMPKEATPADVLIKKQAFWTDFKYDNCKR